MENKRLTYLELLRIIACLFVISIHTPLISEYERVAEGSIVYYTYMAISIFVRCAVPVFFMISGAVLLGKEESLKDVWKNRMLKIIIDLTAFSFMYYMWNVWMKFETFNIGKFFKVLVSEGWVIPFWFLYAYIGFLIILPFLRSMVKNLKKDHYYYLIFAYAFFNVTLPIICYIFPSIDINEYIGISGLASMIVIYPCIGYFFANMINSKSKSMVICFWLVDIILLVLSCIWSKADGILYTEYSVAINSITLFLTVKVLYKQRDGSKVNNIVNLIGNCTFGIYLIHQMFLDRIGPIKNFEKFIGQYINLNNVMLKDIVYVIWIFELSFIVSYIMKKIPIVKKYV